MWEFENLKMNSQYKVRKSERPEVRKKIQIQVGELGSRVVRKEEKKYLV